MVDPRRHDLTRGDPREVVGRDSKLSPPHADTAVGQFVSPRDQPPQVCRKPVPLDGVVTSNKRPNQLDRSLSSAVKDELAPVVPHGDLNVTTFEVGVTEA